MWFQVRFQVAMAIQIMAVWNRWAHPQVALVIFSSLSTQFFNSRNQTRMMSSNPSKEQKFRKLMWGVSVIYNKCLEIDLLILETMNRWVIGKRISYRTASSDLCTGVGCPSEPLLDMSTLTINGWRTSDMSSVAPRVSEADSKASVSPPFSSIAVLRASLAMRVTITATATAKTQAVNTISTRKFEVWRLKLNPETCSTALNFKQWFQKFQNWYPWIPTGGTYLLLEGQFQA